MLGRLNARMLREICTSSHAHNVGYVAAIPILFTHSIQIPIICKNYVKVKKIGTSPRRLKISSCESFLCPPLLIEVHEFEKC